MTPAPVVAAAPVANPPITLAPMRTSVPVVNPEPGEVSAGISAFVIISFATLAAVHILCKRATNAKSGSPSATDPREVPQMPVGGIPMAMAMQIDPETAISPPSAWEMKMNTGIAEASAQQTNLAPPYAPLASTPPSE